MNIYFITTLTSFTANGLCWTKSSFSNSHLACFILEFLWRDRLTQCCFNITFSALKPLSASLRLIFPLSFGLFSG